MRSQVLLLLSALVLSWGLAPSAFAVIQFQKEFHKVYKVDKKAEKPSKFTQTVLKAKCYLCHQGKKSKKNHNPYGDELAKLLDRKKDAKNPEKIAQVLAKVAKLKINPKDKKSLTYGDLIKAGKLPGGPLKESMKEPPKKDETKKEAAEKTEESSETTKEEDSSKSE